MPAPVRDARVSRRSLAAAAVVLVAIGSLLYAMSWNGEAAGFLSDDAVYLMMADALSPFAHADAALNAYVMRQTIFPPLYPLLLGLLGAGSASLLWAHVITTTTLVLALVVFSVWIEATTRDRVAAIALPALFALLPGTLIHNLETLSEFPYLLFSLIALALADSVVTTRRTAFTIASVVALATLTRSAGLSLAAAYAIWLFVHSVKGRWRGLAIAIVPSLIWLACKTWVFGSRGGYQGLWSGLFEQLLSDDPARFLIGFATSQGGAMWRGLLGNLDLRPGIASETALAVTLIAAIPAWVQRIRAGRLDAIYLFIGGAMVAAYPFPTFFNRLLLPWVPILLFYAWLGLRAATRRFGELRGRPAFAYGYVAVVLLAALPSLAFMAQRALAQAGSGLAHWKHTRYWYRLDPLDQINADVAFRQTLVDASRELGAWVPNGECVFAVHTAVSMLYARRVVEQPPAPAVDPAEFAQRTQRCRWYFVLQTGGSIAGQPVDAYYPAARLSDGAFETVHVWRDPHDPQTPTAMLLRRKPAG